MEGFLCPQTQPEWKSGDRLMVKVTYYSTMALFLILAFVIGVYTYYTQIDGIYVNRPIVFHYWYNKGVVTHKTTKDTYYPGDVVNAKILAQKEKIWPAEIQWTLVDGTLRNYRKREGVLEKGRNERTVLVEKLFDDLAPGEYYFSGVAIFELNFLRSKLFIPLQTNTFMVEAMP